MNTEEKSKDSNSLSSAVSTLHRNIQSLREFVETVESFLKESQQRLIKEKASDFLPVILAFKKANPKAFPEISVTDEEIEKSCGTKVEVSVVDSPEKGKIIQMRFAASGQPDLKDAFSQLAKHAKSHQLLYESTLMSLLSSVELFFSHLIHFYFRKFPSVVGGKEKVFSLDELALFGSVEDARSYLVESRVENILRDSFEEWIAFLRKYPNLSMGYLEEEWTVLTETCQRRNLIVHNGGVVNSIYLSKVKLPSEQTPKKGSKLTVSSTYLKKRFDSFERSCLLIAFELWKKLDPDDEVRGQSNMEINYEQMLLGNWHVAEGLSLFLAGDKQLPETHQLIGKFNYWQAVKRQGRLAEIKEVLEKEEIEAKALKFRLAWYCLTDRIDDFYKALPAVLKSKEISRDELTTWPIFGEARRDKRFQRYASKRESRSSKKKS